MIDREREVVDRVLDEASPGGRRTCRSACRRGRAAASRARPRRPSVTSSVLAPGNFSTTSIRPSPSLTTASPISGWWSDLDVRHVGQAQPAARALDRHLAELLRVGDLVEHVADLQPLLRRLDEPAGARRRAPRGSSAATTTCALPAVAMTWLSVTFLSRSVLAGRPGPGAAGRACPRPRRSPRPARPSGAAASVQRAITDFSIGESSSEDSPIIITRLDDDSGCSIVGAFETFGSACAWVSRSCDELARPVDVGARLEDHHDRRQARNGLRADRVDALRRRSAGPPRAAR